MPQCPSCQAPLDQDFGMVTCSQCNEVLMVDFSGNVQINQEPDSSGEPPSEEASFQEPSEIFEPEATNENAEEQGYEAVGEEEVSSDGTDFESEPLGSFDANPAESTEEDSMSWHGTQEEEPAWAEDEFSQGISPLVDDELESSQEVVQEVGEPLAADVSVGDAIEEEGEVVDPHASTLPDKPDPEPVDISQFANSEASNLDNGDYLYDVRVEGLY